MTSFYGLIGVDFAHLLARSEVIVSVVIIDSLADLQAILQHFPLELEEVSTVGLLVRDHPRQQLSEELVDSVGNHQLGITKTFFLKCLQTLHILHNNRFLPWCPRRDACLSASRRSLVPGCRRHISGYTLH